MASLSRLDPARVVAAWGLVRRGAVLSLVLPATGEEAVRPWLAPAADRPLAGRGVLLDAARAAGLAWLEPGAALEGDDLDRCAEAQGVTVEAGDLLLVRTGWLGRCAQDGGLERWRRDPAPGLAASTARWLEDRGVALLAADTAWVEATPVPESERATSLRELAAGRLGLVLGAGFHLDALAEACAADREHAFLLVLPPPDALGAIAPIALR